MKKRIVIKIGTNLLTNNDYTFNGAIISDFCSQIAKLRGKNYDVILISSGAIISGAGLLGYREKPKSLSVKQACAAIGQPLLMQAYKTNFDKYKTTVAQILLTRSDFEDRNRYLNIRNTILTLLKLGIIPVINENDTVAVDEIKFGDNDTLSALVSSKLESDILIILTDVRGLFDDDPNINKNAKLIPEVKCITKEIEQLAKPSSRSGKGSGGMYTKILAAKISTGCGVQTYIADGRIDNALLKIANGENPGTHFKANDKSITDAKKRWIAFSSKIKGKIAIDPGAATAILAKNSSLLPSGIIAVYNKFRKGDTVSICGQNEKEIARGISNYSSDDLMKIKGKKTSEINKIMEKNSCVEVIHRDNLAVL